MANRWILLIAVAASWAASAAWTMNGLESAVIQNTLIHDFLVNDDSLGGCAQAFPVIAGDGKGGTVAAWTDLRNGGNGNWGGNYFYRGWDVYVQRYDSAGNPAGPNQKVNDNAGNVTSDSKHPVSVAMNRSGRFVVVWQDYRGSYPNPRQGIYYQVFDGQGNPVGSNQKANENGENYSEFCPVVSMDENGGFVIAWEQQNPDYQEPGILFRRFDAEGNPLGGNQNADDGTGRLSVGRDGPSIAMDGLGRFAIAWVGRWDEGWTSNVCFQRFDASADPIGSNQTANDTTVWAEPAYPSIGMNRHGDFIIAWEDSRNHFGEDVDYFDIYYQRYDSSGQAVGDNRMADGGSGRGGQYHPAAAIGEDGRVVVAWHDSRTGRLQPDVYFQQYDGRGLAVGDNRNADEGGETSSQSSPNLSLDETGRFIIVWEDDRAGGMDRDVYLRHFHSSGKGVEASRKANDDIGSTDQTRPAVALAGNGSFIVAWIDERNTFQDTYVTYDIFFRQYDKDGNPLGPSRQVNEEISKIRDPTAPAVAADADGNFVIAWTDARIHSWDIYCQRYDASGRAMGPNEMVNVGDGYDSDQRSPVVAMNSRGDYVIAWTSIWDWDFGIRFQLFDAEGHRVGPIQAPEYSTGGDMPAAAMDDAGRFALAWYISAYYDIQGEVTVVEDVYVERFDAEGKSLGRARKANGTGPGKRGGPSMAMNRFGEFVIAWRDGRNGKNDIYCQRYDSNGSLLGVNQKANDDAGIAAPYSAAVVIDETCGFTVAWSDERMGSGSAILMGQSFKPDGTRNGDHFRIAEGTSDRLPAASSNRDRIIFAWQDNRRSKGFDIYARLTSWEDVTAVSDPAVLPQNIGLLPNYPNPFNPETVIGYSLPASGRVRLSIFNLAGQWVRDLIDREETAGLRRVKWDGTDSRGGRMNSGIYFCRMIVESGGKAVQFTRKLCLVR